MQGTQFAKADKNQLSGLFKYLDGCLEQIVKDNELGALKQALKVATLLLQAGTFSSSIPAMHTSTVSLLQSDALVPPHLHGWHIAQPDTWTLYACCCATTPL